MWTINQVRDFYRSEPQAAVMNSPNLEPVISVDLTTPPEKLRETIRKWLDDFHFRIQVGERVDAYFSFVVEGTSKMRIEVVRMKGGPEQFISLFGLLVFRKEDQEKVNALPERERQCIFSEIGMELRRQKIAHAPNFPQSISIQARVPIPELTQAKLIERVEDVDYAMSLTVLRLSSLLEYGECRDKTRS